jgi:hypothetical protein
MVGQGSGLRERIRLAIEAPVRESEKLLNELIDASEQTKLSILLSGWGRGLAAGLEELALAVDELLGRDLRSGEEPAATTPGPALRPRPEEERSGDSAQADSIDASGEERLLEEAKKSREQTAKLQEESEQLHDELTP